MPQIIDSFRSSTRGWLLGTLAGWGTILLFVAGPVLAVIASGTTATVSPALPFVLSAIAVVIVVAKWIGAMATRYDVASDRLILLRGIVNKSIDEIELYRVKDVRIAFSLINQLADIGTITVTSSDETTRAAPLVMPHVPRARARREELRTLIDAARRSRGVREIDLAHEDM
ncbi:MAG: PH domain-containing protein [Pseudomonadota bacterium]